MAFPAFDSKNALHYVLAVGLVFAVSYVGTLYKQAMDSGAGDEYDLIRKYLLNESPLYGYNKPKLWIHTKYEYNARRWASFGSRSSTDLNQPFIHLCIKSVVGRCADDFNIVLIDDDAFSKLVPAWDIDDVSALPEPERASARAVGLASLLYLYGGMVVPNTFVCTRGLLPLYEQGTDRNKLFVCENRARECTSASAARASEFAPDSFFMGARKDNATARAWLDRLKARAAAGRQTAVEDARAADARWFARQVRAEQAELIDGALVGVRDAKRRPVPLEALFEEDYLRLSPAAVGLYIPGDEVLARHKYSWFATMGEVELLAQGAYVCKLLAAAIVDADGAQEYPREHRDGRVKTGVLSI